MLDMGKFLDAHEFFNFHGAEPAHPSKIVPREIYEHRVLSPFLGIRKKILCKLCIFPGITSPGRVPAIGTVVTRLFSTRTSISGLAPIHLLIAKIK